VAGAGAQSYNSAGAGDEKPEFAQHYYFPVWYNTTSFSLKIKFILWMAIYPSFIELAVRPQLCTSFGNETSKEKLTSNSGHFFVIPDPYCIDHHFKSLVASEPLTLFNKPW
jgi:hypothetical protein